MNSQENWLKQLDMEDIQFMKRFILASGSLKEVAKIYDVTYPTVRVRLNRLIEKIELAERQDDSFVKLVKNLTIDHKIEIEAAKKILDAYQQGGDSK